MDSKSFPYKTKQKDYKEENCQEKIFVQNTNIKYFSLVIAHYSEENTTDYPFRISNNIENVSDNDLAQLSDFLTHVIEFGKSPKTFFSSTWSQNFNHF